MGFTCCDDSCGDNPSEICIPLSDVTCSNIVPGDCMFPGDVCCTDPICADDLGGTCVPSTFPCDDVTEPAICGVAEKLVFRYIIEI